MKQHPGFRPLFLFLVAAAGISFVLCLASDIRMSVSHVPLPGEMVVALAWLAGHALHGSLVVLLPAAYLLGQRSLSIVVEQIENN